MSVSLALRKNDKRIAARGIQWWTNSIYSHCELVVDGVCYSSSAMDKGVRGERIYLCPTKWDIVEIPWVDKSTILEYFNKTDGNTYGWFSLIKSQLFNRNQPIEDTQFCSEWCANALGLPNAVSYSPASLLQICLYLNTMWGTFNASDTPQRKAS